MYEQLIDKPEDIVEYAINELEFDDLCLYWESENLENSLRHHHGSLEKLPEYLYMMFRNILENGGIPDINGMSQIKNNSKEQTAAMLVKKWLEERDEPYGNGIWFRKERES